MKYFTIRPHVDFWHEYVVFRARFNPHFCFSQLARDLGFSASYLSEVLSGSNKGEISARFIGTSLGVMGCSFQELWEVREVAKIPNDPQPEKVNGQSYTANGGTNGTHHKLDSVPSESEKDELEIDSEQRYRYLVASHNFAVKTGYRKYAKK